MDRHIEPMADFFAARVEGYDAHMLANIEGIGEGYTAMAALLPEGCHTLLDLGCGTGLELEAIFARFPALAVTGIDITPQMLHALRQKFPNRAITLVCGDYRTTALGDAAYDAAVSFETMHHFDHDTKRALYRRIHRALRPGGVYIEADYVAQTQAEEDAGFSGRAQSLAAAAQDGLWHIDTPCTVENQLRLLREAGFAAVRLHARWAATALLVARA